MLNSYYAEKLSGLQGGEVKNIFENVELSMIGGRQRSNSSKGSIVKISRGEKFTKKP